MSKPDYPCIGMFETIIYTAHFMEWFNSKFDTSTLKGTFERCRMIGCKDVMELYIIEYNTIFQLPPTETTIIDYYENKWSGTLWCTWNDKPCKVHEVDEIVSFSRATQLN